MREQSGIDLQILLTCSALVDSLRPVRVLPEAGYVVDVKPRVNMAALDVGWTRGTSRRFVKSTDDGLPVLASVQLTWILIAVDLHTTRASRCSDGLEVAWRFIHLIISPT